jgi:Uma2 family endonuclease
MRMSTGMLSEAPALPETDRDLYHDRRFELIDGERVERMLGVKAGRIAVLVMALLENHAKAQQVGLVFAADCGYRIFPYAPKLVRYPDISFVRRGRLPEGEPPDGLLRIVPDVVVEMVSSHDLAEEVENRVMDYVRVQVPLVWVIYPNTRCVRVLRQGGTCSQLSVADELRGEDVLPGFACRVEQLFTY